jgi:uncharacterized membrane protein (DUF2068 family)
VTVDWSLHGCARAGHITYAPAEPELREQLSAQTAWGETWQCLRCAAFVVGLPQATGPAAQAPMVRRGVEIRSTLILRIFAVERVLRALVFGAAAYVVWRFKNAQVSIEHAFQRELPLVRTLFHQLGYNVDHSKLVGLIQHALTLSPRIISLLVAGLIIYAVVELIEAVGLWLAKRWGEYFAMVVTSLGLPYEIYDMTSKITVTRVALFAINLALVLYLVFTKRLLGVRGGKRAYEARLRSQSVIAGAINAAAAARSAGSQDAEAAEPAAGARPATRVTAPSSAPDDAAALSPGTAAARAPGTAATQEPGTAAPPGERATTP